MSIESFVAKTFWLCAAALLAGCAGTPTTATDTSASDGLRNTNLDVMFATEYPVASEEEAIVKATNAYRAGEADKALFFYVRALQFNPQNVDVLALIGDIHLQRKDYVKARRAFARASMIDPQHAGSLEALGLIHMVEGRDDIAIADLMNAVTIDERRWRAHNAIGVYLDKAGDYDAAQAHYDSALAENPGAGQILSNRGYSKYLAGDLSGATVDLYTAASDMGFELAWGNLGTVYASQGLYEDAVSAYREIMSEANAYNSAGQMAIENGDLVHAKRFLDEAVRLSPTYFPQAQRNLELLQALNWSDGGTEPSH